MRDIAGFSTKIQNLFIYVADGLRWDHPLESITNRGPTLKTVAGSLYSPPSFATLFTGIYPQQHGVHNWTNTLPEDIWRLTELDTHDTGFRDSKSDDRLFKTLGVEEPTALSELEPPFVHMERDQTTHYPYDQQGGDPTYFEKSWETIEREYRDSVDTTVERFERRLGHLEERGILEDTLVVFTSDHGELLGEYGDTLHVAPACPELVYVPTVFIYPSLSADDLHVDPETEVIEHVDLVETALSRLDTDHSETMGTDVLTADRPRDWGYNHANVRRKGITFYHSDSAWWHDGGHAFVRNSRLGRLLYYGYKLLTSVSRHKVRRTPLRTLRTYLRNSDTFGSPPLPSGDTREAIAAFVETLDTVESASTELDEETREQLREMGYLT